jgi:hypothetical protein
MTQCIASRARLCLCRCAQPDGALGDWSTFSAAAAAAAAAAPYANSLYTSSYESMHAAAPAAPPPYDDAAALAAALAALPASVADVIRSMVVADQVGRTWR